MVKNKYIPWICTLLFGLITIQIFGILAAAVIGYIEAYKLNKKHIIRLSFSFYQFLEDKLPKSVKDREDYTPISSV